MPPLPAPAPPKLLPITDAGAISWQGSVGARVYVVERAPQAERPLDGIGDGVDESFTQYRPQFSDESATQGKWFYRVSRQKRRRRFRALQCRRTGEGVCTHAGG